MSTPSLADLVSEMTRLSQALDKALDYLYRSARAYAEADNAYREAKARAYLAAEGTIPEREAQVDVACTTERLVQRMADADKHTATEAVRSRRAQLSACQSVANAVRAEAEMVRTGPQVAA